MSNAVDLTVGNLDFSDIAGEKVYLDSKYVVPVKGFGFVNANYICLLYTSPSPRD